VSKTNIWKRKSNIRDCKNNIRESKKRPTSTFSPTLILRRTISVHTVFMRSILLHISTQGGGGGGRGQQAAATHSADIPYMSNKKK
jgi:hypothetical protein